MFRGGVDNWLILRALTGALLNIHAAPVRYEYPCDIRAWHKIFKPPAF